MHYLKIKPLIIRKIYFVEWFEISYMKIKEDYFHLKVFIKQ